LPALFYLLFSTFGWLSPALQLYLALPAPLELKWKPLVELVLHD